LKGLVQLHHLIWLLFGFVLFAQPSLNAQNIEQTDLQKKGQFSGSFDMNGNWFIKDEDIGASGIPQYDEGLFGIEAWLNLKYRISGFEVGMRFDFFNNSDLLNPSDVYSMYGLGRVYASKSIGKFDIMAGYIYDQIGSGIIFRAYEERALFIDNALIGGRLKYSITDDIQLTILGGKQRNLVGWGATNWGRPAPAEWNGDIFPMYDSWLYGGKIDAFFATEDYSMTFTPGIGVMSKKLSDSQVDGLENALGTYTPEDFIECVPYYTYAFSVYNTLQAGSFAWYTEAAYKTDDTFYDQFAPHLLWTGEEVDGKYVVSPGYVIYNAVNYSLGKFAVSAEYKVTKDFVFRADPFATLNRGMVTYLPPMARVNTYRLTGRYAPATQDLGELAGQLEFAYRPSRKHGMVLNGSHINTDDGVGLYREIYFEYTWKRPRKSTLITGIQHQWYNQDRYEGKPGVPIIKTITPYVDYLWIFDRKKSLRMEVQYMHTEQDYGSWLWAFAEFSIAPHWIFEISDMWNVVPKKSDKKNHYPTVGVTYSVDSHRFSVRYVKQVEGVVCSGGICRLEPAFSGVRMTVSTQF